MKIRQVSRRIAYGFSFEETMLDEDNFIKNAKQQLERLPDFNPWQYIAELNDPGMNIDGDEADEEDKKLLKTVQPMLTSSTTTHLRTRQRLKDQTNLTLLC